MTNHLLERLRERSRYEVKNSIGDTIKKYSFDINIEIKNKIVQMCNVMIE